MALSTKQIEELNAASARMASGAGSDVDKRNIDYATKTYGYSYSPLAATPVETQTVPTQTVTTGQPAIFKALPDSIANNNYINALYQYAYKKPATQAELNKFSGMTVKDAANTIIGKSSPFYGGAKPVGATDVIPADQLGVGNLSDILGNLNLGAGGSDIAGLLSLYGQQTGAEKQYDELTGQLTSLMEKLGGQSADVQAELEKQGVPAAIAQLKELNLRAGQLSGDLQKFDAETTQLTSNLENQAIPTGLIVGQQAQLNKQRDLTRLSKASELASTLAMGQAYQGNVQLGTQLAQQAIDLKYQPILNQIETVKAQIGFASEKMSREETKKLKIIDTLLTVKMNEIQETKQNQLNIDSIAMEAAANGAPLHLIQSIKTSGNAVDATRLAGKYLTVNVEYERGLAAEERDYQRQLSLKSGAGITAGDLYKDPLKAFLDFGGQRLQTKDGGFEFYDPSGNKISVEEAANLIPGGTAADFLAGSRNPQDQAIIQQSKGKPMAAAQKQQIANAQSGLNQLNTIRNLIANKSKKDFNKLIIKSKLPFGGFSSEGQVFADARNEITDIIARLRTGAVLTTQEEKFYKKFVPKLGDTKATIDYKLNRLTDFFNQVNSGEVGQSQQTSTMIDLSQLESFITQ